MLFFWLCQEQISKNKTYLISQIKPFTAKYPSRQVCIFFVFNLLSLHIQKQKLWKNSIIRWFSEISCYCQVETGLKKESAAYSNCLNDACEEIVSIWMVLLRFWSSFIMNVKSKIHFFFSLCFAECQCWRAVCSETD